MRNPKWHKDEIILALDLYFDKDRGSIDKNNPKIIELSATLNQLPLFTERPDAARFRNPNGVTLKLSNFLAIDPNYTGRGMESYSKLDAAVFEEFRKDTKKLHAIANEIKSIIGEKALVEKIYQIENDEETITDSVMEGQVLYKLHKVRERDQSIVRSKKEQVIKLTGVLTCEVCIFDFEKQYGNLGKGYMECHHKAPLSSFKKEKRTSLDDLALVCANCHRMLHRSMSTLTVDDLKTKIFKYYY
jgi:5-methylcytosine-specific restriction protein A